MEKQILIAPSLLSCNFAYIAKEVDKVVKAGADLIHLDVMDGHFVNNLTFGPCVVKAIREITDVPLDVHLMISHPEKYIDEFIKAGADWISFHIEAIEAESAEKIVEKIKQKGKKAGIAIKPKTPLGTIEKLLSQLDMVLIMSVEPGFGGQKFMPEVLDKVRYLRENSNCPTWIEIDGGINAQTAALAAKAGVNILVAGSFIFNSTLPQEKIIELKSLHREV